jgi:hypothetical protein
MKLLPSVLLLLTLLALPTSALAAEDEPVPQAPPPPAEFDPTRTGHVIVEGTAGLNTLSSIGDKVSVLTLAPAVGVFVVRGLALGAEVAHASHFGASSYYGQTTVVPMLIVMQGNPGGSFFFNGALGFGLSHTRYSSSFGSGSNSATRLVAYVGVMPVIGGHLGVPVRLRANYDHYSDNNALTTEVMVGLAGIL